MPANESIEGQILSDTLSQIYKNLGDEMENLSVQRVAVGLFLWA